MKKIALHWQILIALFLAILYGIFFKTEIRYVSWMGDVFLRLLKMVIIPLVVSSLLSGLVNIENLSTLRKISFKTISYYLFTSLFAILTGLFLINIFKPGVNANLTLSAQVNAGDLNIQHSLKDIVINFIPDNIFKAATNGNMLPIIFFTLFFGIFLAAQKSSAATQLKNLFQGIFEVMMKITLFIIKLTPFGIFGIVAKVVSEQENLLNLVLSLGKYMLVVIGALLIHAVITLPVILKIIGKINPIKHFKAMSSVLLTAFSTSSSSATLPLTLDAVENKVGVSNKISSFTLPLGATINMDGTALYEIIVALFIAQAYGIELTLGQQLLAVAMALMASIGAAGIPMAGMVMITIVLSALNLPLEGVGLVLSVDKILDMMRTAVNVWSDSCGSAVIAKSEGEHLNV